MIIIKKLNFRKKGIKYIYSIKKYIYIWYLYVVIYVCIYVYEYI